MDQMIWIKALGHHRGHKACRLLWRRANARSVGQRSTTEKTEAAARKRVAPKAWLIAIVLAGAALAAYFERGTLYDWLAGPRLAATIPVSGNIEAHQSVLGFKTVQSRIVELPFDEGQWVDKGTLIARLDDADYRQQVVINQATLNMPTI